MTKSVKKLPREVSALVHHVELNKAGWWDKTLNQLTLAAIWLSESNPDRIEIEKTLKDEFGLSISSVKTSEIIENLIKDNSLVQVANDQYRIPDKVHASLEQEIKATEQNENAVKDFFQRLATQYCPTIEASVVWKEFENRVLFPLVRDIGANTYNLLIGEKSDIESNYADNFIKHLGQEHRDSLREIAQSFMDSKRDDVRGYVSRLLHAQFCVESSGLSKDVIDRLTAATDKPTKFHLFVDTNFLFSLLGLHENPSNDSAQELKTLLSTLKNNPQIKLYVTPRTIDEAKKVIGAARDQACNIPPGSSFTLATLHSGISGMTQKYLMERTRSQLSLTADNWFAPYLNNFVKMARNKGVELFNEKTDTYSTRQDVVDDINRVINYEKEKYSEDRRKSYETISHDIILWHLVQDRRPAYVESPTDAQEWVLTVDYRFLGFDQHKLKINGATIPICLHPTSLIQLLQFWVPRSKEFEEAILGGMRLPFLFQEFDVKAEHTSVTIINKLGRFEGNENFTKETIINVVTNEGLRARMEEGHSEEEEVQLVRDALIKELKKEADAERVSFGEEKKVKDLKIEQLQQDLKKEKATAEHREIEKDNQIAIMKKTQSELEQQVTKLKNSKSQNDERRNRRLALSRYLVGFLLILIVSISAEWASKYILPVWVKNPIGLHAIKISFGICVFITLHLLFEKFTKPNNCSLDILPFILMRRFRKKLWGIIVTLGISILGGLIANDAASRPPQDYQTERPATPAAKTEKQ